MVERLSCCRRIQLFAFNNHETKIAWFSISRLTTTDNVYWLATFSFKVEEVEAGNEVLNYPIKS